MNLKVLIIRLKSVSIDEYPYRIKQIFQRFCFDFLHLIFPIIKYHQLRLGSTVFVRSNLKSDNTDTFPFVDIYRLTNFDIVNNTKWRKDHYHNINSPIVYYSFIDKQNFEEYGDVKYVWEISRFYHLPFSALLSQESNNNLSELIQKQILGWIEDNPYLKSINWVSGIEVGVRTINWTIAVDTLWKNNLVNEDFLEHFKQSLNQHVYYLRTHLSEHSSANNHLIAELVGLLYGAAHLEGKRPKLWFNYALDRLENEISNQYCEDGGSKEQSIHYHAFTLDLYLFTWALLENLNLSFTEGTKHKIYKAAKFLRAFWTEHNSCIEFGDSDNSFVVYNPFEKKFDHYASILSSCANIFDDPGLLPGTEYNCFHSSLLTNHLTFKKQTKQVSGKFESNEKELACVHFPETGYTIAEDEVIKIIIDAGFLGMGSTAAHGHSDILHFTLNVNGFPLIVDTGTYQYHRRYSFWRNYFRSSEAHNTISVNKLNQAEMLGRMNWGKRPFPKILNLNHNKNFFELEACHDGFERQGVAVIHKRKFSYDRKNRKIRIHDFLTSNESKTFKYRLHFHPEIESLKLIDDIVSIKDSRLGNVSIKSDLFNKAKLVYGDDRIPLGWYSKSFDEIEPTYVLKLDLKKKDYFEIKTEIKIFA